MATLQKIRNRGTLLMLIVGLALFAFIIGDAVRNSSSYFGNSENMVGEVDGEPISYMDYRKKITEDIQQAEQQRGRVSTQERDMLEAQAWNQMVEKIILGKSQEDLGIVVTTNELSHIFTKKTDDVVKRAFGDADEATIAKQISDVENGPSNSAKKQFQMFTEYVKQKRLKDKFFSLISKGLDRNVLLSKVASTAGKVDFSYVRKDYSTIPDSTITVTDDEIKAYYNENKTLFKQVSSRDISYVKIEVVPSAEDLEFSRKSFAETKEKFAQSKNPMRFASVNSEIKPDTRYLKKSEIRDVALVDYVFSGKDEVFGPYGSGYTMRLARVVDRKVMPDSVKASHILLRTTKTVKKLADSIMQALNSGADFAVLAKKYSEDKNSAVKGGELGWFGKGQMIPAFQEVAFKTAKGEIAKVDTQFGTHIIKVLDRGEEHENVQIAVISKETTPSNKTFQVALTEARHIAENVKTLDELAAVAQEKRLALKDATFYTGSIGVRDIPNSKELVRNAFKMEEANTLLKNKDNSTVFEFDECYVVAGLKDIKEKGYASVNDEDTKDFIVSRIRQDKKAEILMKNLLPTLSSVATLEEFGGKENLEVKTVTGATFRSNYLSGLGQEPEVIAQAVLNKDKTGVIGKAIKGNQGIYVLGNIHKIEDSAPDYEALTSFYNKSLQRKAAQLGYQALYENAEIEDERYRF